MPRGNKRHGRPRTWIVSRCNPWPDGNYTVEIADDLDTLDPSLYWENDGSFFDQHCKEYDDPRDAAAAAIEVRKVWQENSGEHVFVALANPFYPSYANAMTDDEVNAWAEATYEKLPVCAHCGAKKDMPEYESEWGDEFHACDDYHAREYVWDQEESELDAQADAKYDYMMEAN